MADGSAASTAYLEGIFNVANIPYCPNYEILSDYDDTPYMADSYAAQNSYFTTMWEGFDGWSSNIWSSVRPYGDMATTWWSMDLGRAKTVLGFYIHHYENGDNAYWAKEFKLWSSDNGSDWTERYHETEASGAYYQAMFGTTYTHRYWKFTGIEAQDTGYQGGWQVNAFKLLGYPETQDNTPAYLEGDVLDPVNTDSSQTAFLEADQLWWDDLSAYLTGATPETDSQPAFIYGGGGNTDSQSAYIEGAGSYISSCYAYLAGDQKESQHAYLAGVIKTVNGTEIVIIGGVLYG